MGNTAFHVPAAKIYEASMNLRRGQLRAEEDEDRCLPVPHGSSQRLRE